MTDAIKIRCGFFIAIEKHFFAFENSQDFALYENKKG